MLTKEEDLNLGHRSRLRERFNRSSFGSMADYELLEILLFLTQSRVDVKPISKKLLAEFGDLKGICNATNENLLSIPGVGPAMIASIKLIKELSARLLRDEIKHKTILQSWSGVIDYLKLTMSHLKTEQFRVLYLNKKNILLSDELQEIGTVDQTPVYPREIVKRALFHEASAIILVHNHPSGNASPSAADINMTQKIIYACQAVNVSVHDHIIISHADYYSFKSNMLI
jgi:DNA repair protein RadC